MTLQQCNLAPAEQGGSAEANHPVRSWNPEDYRIPQPRTLREGWNAELTGNFDRFTAVKNPARV